MTNNVLVSKSEILLFLNSIYPEPFSNNGDAEIEMRVLGDLDKRSYGSYWYSSIDELITELPALTEEADQNHACLAISPALRKRKSGTKDDVLGSWCLWNDQNQRDGGKQACVDRLREDVLDVMVVDSGHAAHGYVLLDKFCTDIAKIEKANQLLKQRWGGDHVHDASRVMRLPGTTNYKQRDNPQPCRLLHLSIQRYDIDELIDLLEETENSDESPEEEEAIPCPQAEIARQYDDALKILAPATIGMMCEKLPVGDRSEHDLAVVNRLVAAGLPDAAIENVFAHYPCGEKARENGFATYMERTIAKARSNGSQFSPVKGAAPNTPEGLKGQIGEIRVSEKTASARQEAIAQVVLDYFACHGEFFTDGVATGHLHITGQTYLLSDNRPLRALLHQTCGMSLENKDGKLALDHLANHALLYGKVTTTRGPVYVNRKSHTIYLHPGGSGGEIIRISNEGAKLVANGTNEDQICLTASPELRPFQFNPQVDIREALELYRSTVVDQIACDDIDRQTLMLWFPNVFLLNYSTIKIVVKMGGAQASGKSAACRLLGALLAGSDILKIRPTVSSLYADSLPMQIIDNVENKDLRGSLEDIILFSATGGTKEKMRLNSDDQRIRHEVNCLLLLNGIESFDRSEILSRIYEVDCDRQYQQPGFVETEALDNVLAARDTILSGLILLLVRQVLPRIALGGTKTWKMDLEAKHHNHPKGRSFEFLARMGLIAEAIQAIEHPTLSLEHSYKAAEQQIAAILDRQSGTGIQANIETNVLAARGRSPSVEGV
jgi:hypothetical protein